MGESRWKVFEVTSVYTGQKRAMKCYPADPDTGEFSTPDLIAELCATRLQAPECHVLRQGHRDAQRGVRADELLCRTTAGWTLRVRRAAGRHRRGHGQAAIPWLLRRAGTPARRVQRGAQRPRPRTSSWWGRRARTETAMRRRPPSSRPRPSTSARAVLSCLKKAERSEAFAAPELLRQTFRSSSDTCDVVKADAQTPIATKAIDVYRLGCSIYQVLNLSMPFSVAGGPRNETTYRIPLKHRYTLTDRTGEHARGPLPRQLLRDARAPHQRQVPRLHEALPRLRPRQPPHRRRGPRRSVVSGGRMKRIGGEQQEFRMRPGTRYEMKGKASWGRDRKVESRRASRAQREIFFCLVFWMHVASPSKTIFHTRAMRKRNDHTRRLFLAQTKHREPRAKVIY